MESFGTLLAFALVSPGMVCTPGPNMIYLISRSITQGRKAGVISRLQFFLLWFHLFSSSQCCLLTLACLECHQAWSCIYSIAA
jgi:threonine/homoserine/homoserine lactone efflux protein